MKPASQELAKHIGPAGRDGVEFWYPIYPAMKPRVVRDLVPLFITHCETFGREFWPSWN
jgi:hypothetical protein